VIVILKLDYLINKRAIAKIRKSLVTPTVAS